MEHREELRKNIQDILVQCMNCRFCLPSCPLFEITKGDVSNGASGITQALYWLVKWDVKDKGVLANLKDLIYSCTTCKNCELACAKLGTGVKMTEALIKGRQLLIEDMIGPMPGQRKVLESLERYGNPYGMLPSDRKGWMKNLNAPGFSSNKKIDVLFYVGCTAPHDSLVGQVATAIIRLLKAANVSFGILEDETCCGCPSLKIGDDLLFEDLAQKNLEQFHKLEIKHIVTLSPHCFDTFQNEYPEEKMAGINVQHYTQFLADLVGQKKLTLKKMATKKVAYHDPCYLGRRNNVFETPRQLISSVQGLELIEFRRSLADSLCCGGGGGRMWSDFEQENERMANIRTREGLETGAEIILTACPFCLINMADGIKSVNAEGKLQVKDLAQFLADVL